MIDYFQCFRLLAVIVMKFCIRVDVTDANFGDDRFRFLVEQNFLANVNSSSCSLSSSVRLSSVCLSSVTFVRPTQAIQIFGNVSTPCATLAISDLSIKILRRSSQGNPSSGGLNRRGVAKYSDFGPFQGYISEMVQDTR